MLKVLSLVLFLVFTITSSMAMECSYGTLGQDNHMKIYIEKDGVEFVLHETYFKVEEKDLYISNPIPGYDSIKVIGALNKKVQVSAEGDEYEQRITSVIGIANNKAVAALIMDGQVVRQGVVLGCKE